MERYGNYIFHRCCSHYMKEGFKYLYLTGEQMYFHKHNIIVVCELNFSYLREIIHEVDDGLFERYSFQTRFIFLCQEDLLPLGNYFILKSNYRSILIRKSNFKESLKIFNVGRKILGQIITEKEYLSLALSMKGERGYMDDTNRKTFYSRRDSALRKLGRSRITSLYA